MGTKKEAKLWVNTKYAHPPMPLSYRRVWVCFRCRLLSCEQSSSTGKISPDRRAARERHHTHNTTQTTPDVPTTFFLFFSFSHSRRKLRRRNIACMDEMMSLLACFKRCNFEDDRKCAGEKKKLDECLIFQVRHNTHPRVLQ